MVIDKKIANKAMDWATSQTFNNVLLLMILCAIIWVGVYSITTAIPAHLTQIQNGYEAISAADNASVERIIKIYDKRLSEQSRNRSTTTSLPTASVEP